MATKRRRLRFNSKRATRDFQTLIRNEADNILEEYYKEIKFQMDTTEGKQSLRTMTKDDEYIFRRMVIGYADAIMDSYGKGSKMDINNPFLDSYKNSQYWNTARLSDNVIRGRPKGTYKNIYGEMVESSGRMVGIDLEKTGNPMFEPKAPSKAFQDAETWFIKGDRVKKMLIPVVKEFTKSMSKYFEFK